MNRECVFAVALFSSGIFGCSESKSNDFGNSDSGVVDSGATDAGSGPIIPEEVILCGGSNGRVCPDSMFCDFEPSCPAAGTAGRCVERPTDCAGESLPVCDCNGVEYSSECAANAAGVDIDDDCIVGGGEETAMPECGAVGTRSEGWYTGDTLVCWANCKGSTLTCMLPDAGVEGWYASDSAGCSGDALVLEADCAK